MHGVVVGAHRCCVDIKTTAAVASTAGDHFNEGIERGGMVCSLPLLLSLAAHRTAGTERIFG